MCRGRVFLWRMLADVPVSPPTEPIKDILEGKIGLNTGNDSIWYRMDIPGLYELLLMILLMIGTICILVGMIRYLTVSNREIRQEVKEDILHRMKLLFFSGMTVTIMDFLLIIGHALNGG